MHSERVNTLEMTVMKMSAVWLEVSNLNGKRLTETTHIEATAAPPVLLTQSFCCHNPASMAKPERRKEPPRIWFGPDPAISRSHGDSGLGIYSNLYRLWAVCWRRVFWLVCESLDLIVIMEKVHSQCCLFRILKIALKCVFTCKENNVYILQLNPVWLYTCAHIRREIWCICIYIYNNVPLLLLYTAMPVFLFHPFRRSLDQFLLLLDTKLVISHL